MTGVDIQPDLFGGAAVIGAPRQEQRRETEQCVGQTDVFSQLLDVECEACTLDGSGPAPWCLECAS